MQYFYEFLEKKYLKDFVERGVERMTFDFGFSFATFRFVRKQIGFDVTGKIKESA